MSDIDEFKGKLRDEVEAAKQRVQAMQAETAEQYRQLQAHYKTFLEVSQRIRDTLRPRVEAFGEAFPEVAPTVSRRDFGPAGRGFHGVFVTFAFPRTERCAATINLRFSLEAGPSVENLILTYDLEILPIFLQFEQHDQIVLPLDPSSVEKAVEWFDRKAFTFTKTYISIFFNPHYQKGSEVPDIVLGMTFPRMFAKGQAEHGGATYYFFTEESQKAFEQDPDRYVGVSTAP
jgi:YHS domain-containing protein